jgi:GNAT superfamily N-acetyltransferase
VTLQVLRPGDPAQVEAAYLVASRCELDAVGWTDSTRESVRASLTAPDAWAGQHLLAHLSGEPVGLLVAELDLDGREVFLDAYAIGESAPTVQRVLLERGLSAARGLAEAQPAPAAPPPDDPRTLSPDSWQVVSASFAADRPYADVLSGMGFRPIRRFWRMLLDLASTPATEPPAPAGVSRRVVSGDEDRRVLHTLFMDSFATHFGTHQRGFDEWIASVEALPGADPGRWWIATLEGTDVGLCILDDSKVEFGEGYVRTLGVVDAARGRGIGRWLLECAAADSVARGRTGLALAVDGENTTGATALYESVGFTTRHVIDLWCLSLT